MANLDGFKLLNKYFENLGKGKEDLKNLTNDEKETAERYIKKIYREYANPKTPENIKREMQKAQEVWSAYSKTYFA